jgi:hypothetical protein
MTVRDDAKNEKDRLGNVWLSFATAVVAGRTRPSFDDSGKVIALDTEDIENDAIETANRMTKAFDVRFGTKVKKADLNNFEIEPQEEERGRRRRGKKKKRKRTTLKRKEPRPAGVRIVGNVLHEVEPLQALPLFYSLGPKDSADDRNGFDSS